MSGAPTGRARLLEWSAACGLYLYLIATLASGLERFPALHGDEAWFGLFALRMREGGITTLNGMNWYTGSTYGWLLSWMFALRPPGVGSLRLVGVVANAGALLLLTAHFGRRRGARGALAWLGLWASTPIFVVKSRVAWEVYALQPAFMALTWFLVYTLLDAEGDSFWRTLAFVTLTTVAVSNHVIFVTVPVSLGVLLTVLLLHDANRADWRVLRLWRAVAVGLPSSALILAARLVVSDAVWSAHRMAIGALIGAGLLCATLAASTDRFDPALKDFIARRASSGGTGITGTDHVAHVARVAGAALAIFAAVHGLALFNVGSGVAVVERVWSWQPGAGVSVVLYVAFAVVVALVIGGARRAWIAGPAGSCADRVVALWPLAYMAIFTAFRLNAPVRHYVLLMVLLVASAAQAASGSTLRWMRAASMPLVLAMAVMHVALWREILHPATRRPVEVRVGWIHDTSKHFLPLGPLYRAMEESHTCSVVSPEMFLRQCLEFFIATHALACDPAKAIEADYCTRCPGPPYLTWRIVGRRAP